MKTAATGFPLRLSCSRRQVRTSFPARALELDPHARRFLRLLAAGGGAEAARDLGARRRALEDLAGLTGGRRIELATVETLSLPGPGGELRIRRYTQAPVGPGPAPAMVYLHGGGWCAGSLDTHDGVCRALAGAGGFTVLAVDYRLAPELPFPAALHDAIAAVDWVVAHAQDLAIDAARLGIAGDSAGAALAAATAACLRDRGGPPLAMQLLICPILDVSETRASRRQFAEGFFLSTAAFAEDLAAYLPIGVDAADPRVSPLRAASFVGLPPTRLHLAACDPFRDEGLDYAAALQAAGVEIACVVHPGMIHYFYAMPGAIPYARSALDSIAQDARGVLSRNHEGGHRLSR